MGMNSVKYKIKVFRASKQILVNENGDMFTDSPTDISRCAGV